MTQIAGNVISSVVVISEATEKWNVWQTVLKTRPVCEEDKYIATIGVAKILRGSNGYMQWSSIETEYICMPVCTSLINLQDMFLS